MNKIVLSSAVLLVILVSFPALGKTVNLSIQVRVTTCSKKSECLVEESAHQVSTSLTPLGETGLDMGIVDLYFNSPIQKFNFKMVASIFEGEKEIEMLFVALDEKYNLNKVLLKMGVPRTLNESFQVESPEVRSIDGVTSKMMVKIQQVETLK